MPTPTVFEAVSIRLFPIRWHLLAISGVLSLLLFATLAAMVHFCITVPTFFFDAFLLTASAIIWAFALFLLPTWFHPQRGAFGRNKERLAASPRWVQVLTRAYASFMLTCLFALPVILLLAVWGGNAPDPSPQQSQESGLVQLLILDCSAAFLSATFRAISSLN